MGKKAIDLKNKRFGKLLVLERDYSKKSRHIFWICKCDCGNVKSISGQHLKSKGSKSCGCEKTYNLEGKKFGRWTVIERIKDKNSKYNSFWLCKCDCGNYGKINTYTLTHNKSFSCGCYQKEVTIKRLTTHNKTKTRLYRILIDMKNRCYKKNDKRYYDYGGRGIIICKEWLDDFMNFYNWSIQNGYNDELSIDRIDNNKGYNPDNCRWSNIETQSNNKRNTIYFEFLGIKKSLKQWTNFMNWDYKKYHARNYRGYETFREDEIKMIENKLKEVNYEL